MGHIFLPLDDMGCCMLAAISVSLYFLDDTGLHMLAAGLLIGLLAGLQAGLLAVLLAGQHMAPILAHEDHHHACWSDQML